MLLKVLKLFQILASQSDIEKRQNKISGQDLKADVAKAKMDEMEIEDETAALIRQKNHDVFNDKSRMFHLDESQNKRSNECKWYLKQLKFCQEKDI